MSHFPLATRPRDENSVNHERSPKDVNDMKDGTSPKDDPNPKDDANPRDGTNSNEGTNLKGGSNPKDDTNVFDIHQWSLKPKHVKIICIGAGASGLLLAYKLQRSFNNLTLQVYEKNAGVAGTWFENRYPGCACDIPSHCYTYSFAPKTDWKSTFASYDQIRTYFEDFSQSHNLGKYIKVSHRVCGAVWDTEKSTWNVEIQNVVDDTIIKDSCDILINAGGFLNDWKWPSIPGLHDFQGRLLHTANWDSSVSLKGANVAIIGNGSSGIQVLPAILKEVASVKHFIRSPTWIAPDFGGQQRKDYSADEIQTFKEKPETHIAHRKEIEDSINETFSVYLNGSNMQKDIRKLVAGQMNDALEDENIRNALIPDFPVGCRRITPGIGFLDAINSPKVTVVTDSIDHITKTSIATTTGNSFPVDILICATGFNVSYAPRFPIVAHGSNLQEVWATNPRAYMGLAAAGVPNYFMTLGPNSPVANGPVLVGMEAQADYICRFVNRFQTENISCFAPKTKAVEEYAAFADRYFEKTVFTDKCRSWYKNGKVDGKVTAVWTGSTLNFLQTLQTTRYEDWEFEYRGNRWEYLGNGATKTEVEKCYELSAYIRNEDDGPVWGSSKVERSLMMA